MRPRPATRAALLVEVSLALSLRDAVRRPLKPHSRRMLVSRRSSSHGYWVWAYIRWLAVIASSWRLSPLREEDCPRRPQRQGIPDAPWRVFETLRQLTLENCRKRQLYRNR